MPLPKISGMNAGLQYCKHQENLVTGLVFSQNDGDRHDTEHDLVGISSFYY